MKSVNQSAKKRASKPSRRSKATGPAPAAPVPPASASGRGTLAEAVERMFGELHPPDPGSPVDLRWDPKLREIVGVNGHTVTRRLIEQLVRLVPKPGPWDGVDLLNTAVAYVEEVKPVGVVEAMLAVQMIGTHLGIAESLAAARNPGLKPHDRAVHAGRASALQAGFAHLVEAWSRLRSESRRDGAQSAA